MRKKNYAKPLIFFNALINDNDVLAVSNETGILVDDEFWKEGGLS